MFGYIYTRYNIYIFILQTYSDIGRATWAAQSVPHIAGSKSYARLRHEFVYFSSYNLFIIFIVLNIKIFLLLNETIMVYHAWIIYHDIYIYYKKGFFYNSYYFNRWISMGENLVRWSSIGWLTFIRMKLLFGRSPEIFMYFFYLFYIMVCTYFLIKH